MQIELTPDQKAVFDQLFSFATGRTPHVVASLKGFAGTGKTTLMGVLIDALVAKGVDVAVTAPSHKAVSVIQKKIHPSVTAMTIHSVLGYKLKEREDGTQYCMPEGRCTIAEYDLCIIDEASMVGLEMLNDLMHRRGHCRILFVGDPAQLPPVGETSSCAFGDLIPLQCTLKNVLRQSAEHPSIRWSIMLRDHISSNTMPSLRELESELRAGDEDIARVCPGGSDLIATWLPDAIKHGMEARVLCFDNKSVQAHNARIHAAFYPQGGACFAVGEPVIAQEQFLVSDGTFSEAKNSEIFTINGVEPAQHPHYPEIQSFRVTLENGAGQLGKVFVPANRQQLDFQISNLFATHKSLKTQATTCPNGGASLRNAARRASDCGWALSKSFANLRHAYAMTIHKSQGSTFDTVLLDWQSLLRNRDTPAMKSRLLYVALTRASTHSLVIF